DILEVLDPRLVCDGLGDWVSLRQDQDGQHGRAVPPESAKVTDACSHPGTSARFSGLDLADVEADDLGEAEAGAERQALGVAVMGMAGRGEGNRFMIAFQREQHSSNTTTPVDRSNALDHATSC